MATPRPTPERRLLDAIYDDYDAAAPRLAWADWLTAQGNPWGEVVRLAVGLAAKGKPPSRALRAAEREHQQAGLGPLASIFEVDDDLVFDRGTLAGGWVLRDAYLGAHLDDPRWRGVSWIHHNSSDDIVDLIRVGRLDRLTSLHNFSLQALAAISALPIAARLRALSPFFAEGRQLSQLTAAMIDRFSSLDRFSLSSLEREHDPPALYKWLPQSKVACSQLRMFGEFSPLMLPPMLRFLPQLTAWEAIEFGTMELLRSPKGLALFLYYLYPTHAELFAQIPPGTISTLEIDAGVADKRKHGRAELRALADQLGARLVVRTKPVAREMRRRWKWYEV
jgi:uncharacterized protein (TIGR02996 family)